MKKLTLIGGAPLAGKTTLSKELAAKDGAVELSTDSVRAWMRNFCNAESNPGLFDSVGITAEQFYENHKNAEAVVRQEVNQGKEVEAGIIGLLNTGISWDHLVIEGIAISPEFIVKAQEKYTDREVEGFIIVDTDHDRISKRIHGRGLWGPIGTYPESLIPKEIEWAIMYNEWFESQAKKFGVEIRYN